MHLKPTQLQRKYRFISKRKCCCVRGPGVLHGRLVCAVLLALPGLRALRSSQPERSYGGAGVWDSEVLFHPPVCASHRGKLSPDLAILQSHRRVTALCTEHRRGLCVFFCCHSSRLFNIPSVCLCFTVEQMVFWCRRKQDVLKD